MPTVLLALMTALVPLMLCLLANLQGQHLQEAVEISVQIYYFVFLFVQVFIVVILSAGIATLIEQFPITVGSIPAVLAANLPKASNYFFFYIIIYILETITASLMQVKALIYIGILSPLWDQTARQK